MQKISTDGISGPEKKVAFWPIYYLEDFHILYLQNLHLDLSNLFKGVRGDKHHE